MTVVDGPAAAALGEVARHRWRASGDPRPLRAPDPSNLDVWPDGLEADITDVPCGVALTLPAWRGRAAGTLAR